MHRPGWRLLRRAPFRRELGSRLSVGASAMRRAPRNDSPLFVIASAAKQSRGREARCAAPRFSHWYGHGHRWYAVRGYHAASRVRGAIPGGTNTMPISKEDVCYLKHGERQIMARVFKPEGPGPFPVYVDLHGGAWNNGDLNDRTGLGEYLAERGVVMVTLNFRHGPDGYPTTLQDINYGVRWVKAHAKELKAKPDQVALGGASSGGHLAMLAA